MPMLILGLIVFFGVHVVPMKRSLREGLVSRFGANGYTGAFSLVSLIGLAMIVYGYGMLQGVAGENPELWAPPVWARHLAATLMLPALILLVAAYVPSRIRTAVGHPMLAAIKLWALAHLLANGDLASVLLFGSFLAYGVVDRISVKRRGGGRGPLGDAEGGLTGDIAAIVIGVAAYLAFVLFGHAWLFGVAPMPALSV